MSDSPRIYVASLTDYNAGILHGRWIEAAQDAEEIHEEVQAMLGQSPTAKTEGSKAEEWAIHDYEGFGGISLSEYESFENIAALAEAVDTQGTAFALWVQNIDPGHEDVSDMVEAFTDAYSGEHDSKRDFAMELAEDTDLFGPLYDKELDSHPSISYFDWDAWTRDLFMGDYYALTDPHTFKVHVFRNL